MPALALNGVTVPGAAGSGKRSEPERLGARGRGLTGAAYDATYARKWGFKARLTPKTPPDAQAWRGMLAGRGDKWSFDAATLVSAWGRAHTLVSGVAGTSSPGPYGASDKYVTSTGEIRWTLPTAAAWTLLAHAQMSTPNWTRWIIRSDGRRWKNGAAYTLGVYDDTGWLSYDWSNGRLTVRGQSAATTAWAAGTLYAVGNLRKGVGTEGVFKCTVAGLSGGAEPAWDRTSVGATTVDNAATWAFVSMATARIADMAWLPFSVPDSWVSSVDAEMTARAWTLPHLRATGDVVENAPKTVDGTVTGSGSAPFISSGQQEAASEAVEFELREV